MQKNEKNSMIYWSSKKFWGIIICNGTIKAARFESILIVIRAMTNELQILTFAGGFIL